MRRGPSSGWVVLVVALCGACGSGAIEAKTSADASPPSGAADDPDAGEKDDVGEGAGVVEMDLPVAGDAPWTETGVEVARGDLVWLEATGTIFLNDTTEVGPAGHAPDEHDRFNVIPCADHASLIAGVGDPASPLPQGDAGWLLVPRSGLLSFGPNDTDFDNNQGAFEVHLRAPMAVEVIDERSAAVPGDAGWIDTGVDVSEGDLLAITAGGQVDDSIASPETTFGASGVPATPDRPHSILTCANHVSLIGRIGAGGAPFYVGADLSRLAPATGPLFLGVNDDDIGNNGGKLSAAILVARPP